MATALSSGEIAVLSVLVARGALEWSAAARSSALDDDALADAVDALLLRGAIALVRAREPQPVALEITTVGAATFAQLVELTWRARAPGSSASG